MGDVVEGVVNRYRISELEEKLDEAEKKVVEYNKIHKFYMDKRDLARREVRLIRDRIDNLEEHKEG